MKFRNPFAKPVKTDNSFRSMRSSPRLVSLAGADYMKETRMIAGGVLGGNLGAIGTVDSGNVSLKEATWPTWPMTADQIIWRYWIQIVTRSRECANNNDHGRRYMHLVRDNIVGANGVRLKPVPRGQDGKIDKDTADAILDAWQEYSERPEVTQKHDMVTRDRMLITCAAQDGNILAKKVYGPDAGPYGFGIQILDPFLLDPHFNQDNMAGGNFIRAGIEYNKAGRPIAYYFRKNPNDYWGYNATVDYDRVGADEIIHSFIPEISGQRVGLPWMRTALQRFWHIKGFETAAVINARISASKCGFFRDPESESGSDDDGPLTMDGEPGVFEDIGSKEFIKVDWNWPAGEFDPFLKACLRHAAGALNVANHSLTGDYSGLNYSSIKAVNEDQQESWKALQVWFAMSFKREEFRAWLDFALLSGKIRDKRGRPLPAENVETYRRVKWIGRRWAYLDPLREVSANIQSIIHRLKSRTSVIEENDGDASEVFQEIADEENEIKAIGLTLPIEAGGQQTPNTLNTGSDANGNDDPDDESKTEELERELRMLRQSYQLNLEMITERENEIASLKSKKRANKAA